MVSFDFNYINPSYESANPRLAGSERVQDLLAKSIANQLAMTNYGIQQQYGEPLKHEELQKSLLANKYFAPEKESEIALRGAQAGHYGALTNQINQKLPMEVRALQLANTIKGREAANPLYGSKATETLAAMQDAGLLTPEQVKQYATTLTQPGISDTWKATPQSQQIHDIGQVTAGGKIDSNEATYRLSHGATVKQLMAEQGYDSQHPERYPSVPEKTSARVQGTMDLARIARRGLQTVWPDVANAYAPYAKTIGSISIKHAANVAKGIDDTEEYGKAIAAHAMQMQLAGLEAKAGGAMPGIGMLREATARSMMDQNIMGLMKNPRLFAAAQRYQLDMIEKLNNAEMDEYKKIKEGKPYEEVKNVPSIQKSDLKDRKKVSDGELNSIYQQINSGRIERGIKRG